jgi:hypothetical protein
MITRGEGSQAVTVSPYDHSAALQKQEKPGFAQRILMGVLDKGVEVPGPVISAAVEKLRRSHPDETPAQIVERLDRRFLNTVTASGAAVGAAAAIPGVGTVTALLATGGETALFLAAGAFYTLAIAEVYGMPVEDIERRRALVMGIALGNSGAMIVEKTALRKGKSWADSVTKAIPGVSLGKLNTALAKRLLFRLAKTRGFMTVGRVAPFGIGAVIGGASNRALGKGMILSAQRAFGPPPLNWLTVIEGEVVGDSGAHVLLNGADEDNATFADLAIELPEQDKRRGKH